jgi:predicted ATPase/class 3 adenylate cyclase
VRSDLPAGTVTFLFTDVEGSTRLLHELGAEGYAHALAQHRRLLREAFARHGGVEVDTQGDAFFVAFPTARGALAAAREATEALAEGPIRVRIGLHTGTPLVTDEGYVGADVHRAARIAAAGHGGQVLVSTSTAALVEGDALIDLGEHRLKDLSAPERIYQLGAGAFPPLASLHRTNLPVPATPFLGRDRELEETRELLARADVRVLTLTGTGGTGKTRLALQAAGVAADAFPGGIFWVPLAPLRDPALVLESAASALGGEGELAEQIADNRLLLLFDNFEHLIEAAAGVAELVRRCPNLTVLVTSRARLQIGGEWEYAVDPLRESEAVALFETRARAVKRDFAPNGEVREICARLDHLPLAIELAAARVKVLSLSALLERLERRLPLLAGGTRDAPERQRTLRATIEWSHDLLNQDEQTLFRRLAIFRGGCTLKAAESVCEADLDTLASLVEKSLVRVREGERFWMLETIREYAAEKLDQSGEEEELRQRHAEHFLALAEEAEPHLEGDPKEWLDRLDPEHDNLRAALDELEAAGDTRRVFRLAAALGPFWALRGHLAEGRRRLEGALRADDEPSLERVRALLAACPFAAFGGDVGLERRWAEEALELSMQIGDTRGSTLARYALGNVAAGEGRWAVARDLLDSSVREFVELGDDFRTLTARRGLAWMHEELGDVEGYRELTEENLRLARALGNRRIEARALGALAMLALEDGHSSEAVAMLADAHRIDRDLGNVIFVTVDLTRFAAILAREGRHAVAARVLACAEARREEIGWTRESWAEAEYQATLAAIRAQLDESTFAEAWEHGCTLTADEAVELALAPDE